MLDGVLKTARLLGGLAMEIKAMAHKPNTFTWEWEDAETGEIRTFEIDLSDLSSKSDESEVREIILNRKLRLDDYENLIGSRLSRTRNRTNDAFDNTESGECKYEKPLDREARHSNSDGE